MIVSLHVLLFSVVLAKARTYACSLKAWVLDQVEDGSRGLSTLSPVKRGIILVMKKGFTLIELLISITIFSVIIVAFVSIFLSVVQVQVRQTSVAEVNQQSQLLLQQLQYYVSQSSLIDMPQDISTTTLKLWLGTNTLDPTYITLQNGTVYLQQTAGGTLQPLTSNKVTVSGLSFTRHANPPGHDSVSIAFTINYNTNNVGQMFSQVLQTSVARVSAATFDSNLVPSTATGTLYLGATGATWGGINGVITFSGSNVGIGQASPQQALDVNGGIRFSNSSGYPSCNSTIRGTLWFTPGGSGKDALYICAQNASGTLSWYPIY
jgi:prepilin-type N-terminal cleavage/methylation domain-containing protein